MGYTIKRTCEIFEPMPGLKLSLRRWSDRERMTKQDEIADLNRKNMALLDEIEPLQDRYNEATRFELEWIERNGESAKVDWQQFAGKRLTPTERVHYLTLSTKLGIVNAQVRDAWLETGIASIEGFEIEEGDSTRQGTVAEFIEFADAELLDKAFHRVRILAGLIGDEEKNSDSPTTSAERADGETSASTA